MIAVHYNYYYRQLLLPAQPVYADGYDNGPQGDSNGKRQRHPSKKVNLIIRFTHPAIMTR